MLDVQVVETSSLGDRSYLAHDGESAAVIDPQRDIDRILDLAGRLGVRVTWVLICLAGNTPRNWLVGSAIQRIVWLLP
ncbi:hypothetical protein SAMN05661093_10481 [Kibdelosporangium aridum]|uniref:Uncharacterized protein n=1 Tax=Kibdelosporangium aridum TaxID=2030 RepID=A0A1W2FYN1_KIBAR|nr:hypothetical protein SAMN05661093_10481 [Kibdelosporangium aridum]